MPVEIQLDLLCLCLLNFTNFVGRCLSLACEINTSSIVLYLYEVLGPGREDLSGQWSVWCSRLLNLP